MSRDFLLLGYYGRQNTGDDAMLVALVRKLRAWFPSCKLRVTTNHPDLLPPEVVQASVESVSLSIHALIQGIHKSEAVVLGGGTHFHDLGSKPRYFWLLLRFAVLFAYARLTVKKVVLVGIGIGPLRTWWSRCLVALILGCSHVVMVRDPDSLQLARKLGKSMSLLGFDLAVLLESGDNAGRISEYESPILGINLLPAFDIYYHAAQRDQELVEALSEALEGALSGSNRWRIRLIEFKGSMAEGDTTMMGALWEALVHRQVSVEKPVFEKDPERMLEIVKGCDAMITMRYHACLFSFLAEVPSIWIDYHPKNASLAHDVHLPPKALVPLEVASDEIADRLLDLLAKPESFVAESPVHNPSTRLHKALAEIEARSLRNG